MQRDLSDRDDPGPTTGTAAIRTAPVGASRASTSAGQRFIERALGLARRQLGLDVAYLTQMDSEGQVVRLVSGDSAPMGFGPATTTANEDTFCLRMLQGRLPSAIADTTADPVAMEVGLARDGLVGSYIGVPVRLPGGRLYGTLCGASRDPQTGIGPEDARLLTMLSQLIAEEIDHDERLSAESRSLHARVAAVLESGPDIALQPIVDLRSGRIVGAEALSRFPHASSPEMVFAEAARAGLGVELELVAVRAALAVQGGLPPDAYLAINASPGLVVAGPLVGAIGAGTDLSPFVLEVTEHAAVDDYALLHTALAGLRARGLRLAVDDAGAGFASFRHIVRLRPDVIKLDRSLTSEVGVDPVHDAVVGSYVAFARGLGMKLVAEGVETRHAARALRDLGVDAAQGYLFGRPEPPPLRSVDPSLVEVLGPGRPS